MINNSNIMLSDEEKIQQFDFVSKYMVNSKYKNDIITGVHEQKFILLSESADLERKIRELEFFKSLSSFGFEESQA